MSQHPELRNLTPPQAYEILQQNPAALLIDIRTLMEYQFVGHPLDAIHIPWKEVPGWIENESFISEIQHLVDEARQKQAPEIPIILMCRSGTRTIPAGNKLIELGFTDVYHIDEGFEGDLDDEGHRGNINGWRFHKLPWKQT